MQSKSQNKFYSKELNILVLSWEMFPVYLGGLGFLVKSVVDELERQGMTITTIIPHHYDFEQTPNSKIVSLYKQTQNYLKKDNKIKGLDFEVDEIVIKGSDLKRMKLQWASMFSNSKSSTKKYFNNLYPIKTLPAMTRANAWAVLDWLKEREKNGETAFDLIIGMDWLSAPAFYLLKQHYPKIPFLFYINSTETDRNPSIKGANKDILKLEKDSFKNADGVVAISNVTRNNLIENYGVDEKKILTVFNDIVFTPEPTGYAQLSKGKNLLFVGRITSQKGLQFLVDTLHTLVQIDHQIKLIIAGDGEQTSHIVEMVAEKKLEKNCIFTGWVNDVEKKLLYRSSDLFLMPSPSEPFGLTALESIRSGLPVIASVNCGFIDVVPSTPTFNYHDTSRLVYLILYYLNNEGERIRLLDAQQANLSKHSWVKEVAKLIDLGYSLVYDNKCKN
jgi:glycosyltransferase involved in cell wall biosynthesis